MASEKRSDLSLEQGDSEESDGLAEPELPPRKPRFRSGPGIIPLLETISAIEDLCDSDESSEPSEPLPSTESPKKTKTINYEPVDYSGSSSIDSGYKSSACPTPDLVDGYYTHKKQNPVPGSARVSVPGTQKTSQDLDHLITLRQTLIKAISKYDGCQQVSGQGSGPLTRVNDYGVVSVLKSASANKRNVKLAASGPLLEDVRVKPVPSASVVTTHGPAPEHQIAMLEEEIDSLLHGQMEDASSANRVAQQHFNKSGEEAAKTTAATNRFSRVARCMLEIIEDLQRQYQVSQQQEALPHAAPRLPPKPSRSPRQPLIVASRKPAASPPGETPRIDPAGLTRDPENEYHVYEEIVYELTGNPSKEPKLPQVPPPPPLPARPSRILDPPPKSIPLLLRPKKEGSTWLRSLRKDKSSSSVAHWWKCGSGGHLERPNVRANVYTFSSLPPRDRLLPVDEKKDRHVDEEYGFRIISH